MILHEGRISVAEVDGQRFIYSDCEIYECNAERANDCLGGLLAQTKSPIEQLLAEELYVEMAIDCDYVVWVPYSYNTQHYRRKSGYRIFPQEKVGPYSIDFGVESSGTWVAKSARGGPCRIHEMAPLKVRLAIECDGHEFHEKTKEQAARDKARDRFLLTQGWPTMRFTGSEIYANARGCAREIVATLNGMLEAESEKLDSADQSEPRQ